MLYLFYGSDTDKAREKAGALVEALKKKRPEAEVFYLDAEQERNGEVRERELDELIHGQGLFNKTYIIYLSRVFEHETLGAVIMDRLEAITASPNLFILCEEKLGKDTLLPLTDRAEKVQCFNALVEQKRPELNIFSLADAFGKKDKKKLWVLYQKALESGAVPEEIHGVLFWQLKSILLAESARTATEAGLKPFVWTKAKTFAKHWKTNELRELSAKMIALYHDAHRGKVEFPLALERLILSL